MYYLLQLLLAVIAVYGALNFKGDAEALCCLWRVSYPCLL